MSIVGYASAGLLTGHQFQHTSAHHQSQQQHFTGLVVPGADATAPVLKSESNVNPDGSYSYEYQTGNGIAAQESGVGGKEVHGSYSYTGQDGQPIQVTYVADENGFRPTGAHLPTPPPVPEAIGNI